MLIEISIEEYDSKINAPSLIYNEKENTKLNFTLNSNSKTFIKV